MDFKSYYQSVRKTFNFRIKSAYRLDDESMDIIENILDKYRPEKISKPKKMMFQSSPLGFVGTKNVEIYFIDVELTVPATYAILEYDIRTSFGLAQDSDIIQVFAENSDPMEEFDQDQKASEETEKNGSLLSQPDYPEAREVAIEDNFGDSYNKHFLDYLKTVQKERDINKKIDAPHPITKWEKQPKPNTTEPKQDISDFNEKHKPDTSMTIHKVGKFKSRGSK